MRASEGVYGTAQTTSGTLKMDLVNSTINISRASAPIVNGQAYLWTMSDDSQITCQAAAGYENPQQCTAYENSVYM